MNIGFIGLGNMGLPMARRLLEKSGCPVYGFDIVPAALEKLAAAGGTPEPDSAALLEKSDVIFLSLPSNELVQANLEAAVSIAGAAPWSWTPAPQCPRSYNAGAAPAGCAGVELIAVPRSAAA